MMQRLTHASPALDNLYSFGQRCRPLSISAGVAQSKEVFVEGGSFLSGNR
jgi:hypothetical protein